MGIVPLSTRNNKNTAIELIDSLFFSYVFITHTQKTPKFSKPRGFVVNVSKANNGKT
jgi:hypothetical protein